MLLSYFKKGGFLKISFCIILLVCLVSVPLTARAGPLEAALSGIKCASNLSACLAESSLNSGIAVFAPDSANAGFGPALAFVGWVLISVTSWLTWLAGSLLALVINITIVGMPQLVNNSGGINTAWGVLRDLGNVFFIFILLYAAIGRILDVVSTQKILRSVIILALLINFSLFFTKIIVDVSNNLSIAFYNATLSETIQGRPTTNLATAFMEVLDLQTMWKVVGGWDVFTKASMGTRGLMFGIMGAIFNIITAGIFFMVSFFFISRLVALIILMILSGAAFAAMALPGKNYAKLWWDTLWKHVIFAPVFFAMMWITIKVLNGILPQIAAISPTGGIGAWSGLAGPTPMPGGVLIVVNFLIVIGFMVASITVSQKISGVAGDKLTNWAGGVVSGVRGWAGRNTVGLGARWVGTQYDRAEVAASNSGFAKGLAKVPIIGTLSREIGGSISRGTRGGIRGIEESKFGGGTNFAGIEKQKRDRTIELNRVQTEGVRKANISAGMAGGIGSAAAQTMHKSSVSKMTTSQLEETGRKEFTQLSNPTFASGLTHDQMDNINKSDNFSQIEKNAIRTARESGLQTAWAADKAGGSHLFAVDKRMKSPKEMAQLPDTILTDSAFVNNFTESVLRNIAQEGTLDSNKIQTIRANITAAASASTASPKLKALEDWLKSPKGKTAFA